MALVDPSRYARELAAEEEKARFASHERTCVSNVD